jgi:hypothetical protein
MRHFPGISLFGVAAMLLPESVLLLDNVSAQPYCVQAAFFHFQQTLRLMQSGMDMNATLGPASFCFSELRNFLPPACENCYRPASG